jgi:hypothetical protein
MAVDTETGGNNNNLEEEVNNAFASPTTTIRNNLTTNNNNNNNNNVSSHVMHTSHFLRTCGLCNARLAPARDIYMYRYDLAPLISHLINSVSSVFAWS